MDTWLLNLLALPTVAILLVYTGIKRRPGIGILVSLVVITYGVWSRPAGLAWLGFRRQSNWPGTIGLGLLLGGLIAFLSTSLLEPVVERITGHAHDVSIAENVRGSWKGLAWWLLAVWVFVAVLEEIIFRGYLMGALSELVGRSSVAWIGGLLISSLIFGFAHAYQGPSGVISTGVIGVLIGLIYLLSGTNLWLVILVHGFIDTIQLTFMSANLDQRLRTLLIQPREST
jgi:membrane protease YdiL (CAAX protease family)